MSGKESYIQGGGVVHDLHPLEKFQPIRLEHKKIFT